MSQTMNRVDRPTVRSLAAGLALALLLCAMNSYLTLSFGVIEEGPTIAALIFFALFFLSRTKITSTEMVMVATMGSAGGSFGFIANFYAAKAMIGTPYTFTEMVLFGLVSSAVGLVVAIPLRELLVVRERLPWPGSKATERVIRTLVEDGDRRQPLILLVTFLVAFASVLVNTEDGLGWIPAELPLGPLVAVGGFVSLAPFAIGGSYLMGMRTCVGFLVGAVVLMILAPSLDTPQAPQRFVWPGIGFLTASGLTLVVINWRVFRDSMRSLMSLRQASDLVADTDRVMSPKALLVAAVIVLIAATAILVLVFDMPPLVVLLVLALGGIVQNIIATRAQSQTAFNPARVMGVLLQGACSLAGGQTAAINLTGAGFVAGSGAQAGNLTGDMAYGKALGVKSRWQFFAQLATVIPAVLVSALVFEWIASQKSLTLDTTDIAAPVAKVWAATALIFDGNSSMPPNAIFALVIGAVVGILYTLVERIERVRPWMPCSVGIGIGLVLSPAYGLAFFLGGVLLWIVCGRWLGWREVTLTTVAVACVVAEGLGGVTKALLHAAGVL